MLMLRKRFPRRSNVGYNPRVRGAEETPKPLSITSSQSDPMTKLRGLWRLARFKDYAMSVVFTTCLGVAAAGGRFGWKMVLVLLANWLAVGFAFMFNDAEDAPDDALTPEKALRNPVTNGSLSLLEGHVASYAVAALATLAYLPLGWLPTVCGVLCMAFGHLYSWRRIRLKAVPILDVLSHGLMLAALQMLAAFYTFSGTLNVALIGPLVSMVCASFYGQLFNEVRDLEGDRLAGVHHTASLLGSKVTHGLMNFLLSSSILAGLYTLFFSGLVPWGVIAFSSAFLVAFVIWPYVSATRRKAHLDTHLPFINGLPLVGSIMMFSWFVVPWLVTTFRLNAR
jgi:4-hydroxybenzoate polyprenyltransferase